MCKDGGSQTLALQLGHSYIMLIILGTQESGGEFLLQLASCELSYSLARSREETLDFVLDDDSEGGKQGGRLGIFKQKCQNFQDLAFQK